MGVESGPRERRARPLSADYALPVNARIDFSGSRRTAAFPLLTDEQIALLRRFGAERLYEADAAIFRPGDPTTDFFVVLDGRIAILDDYGRPDERVVV